jgi:ABC-2 type transport system permease protein
MNAVIALAAKDLKLLLRDRVGFFFVFFFPLIYACFFGVIFGGMGGDRGSSAMRILVVDNDRTQASIEYTDDLRADDAIAPVTTEELRVARAENAPDIPDEQWAERLVRDGKYLAFVLIPEGFEESSKRMFWGEPMTLSVGVDPSRKAEAAMIGGLLTSHAYRRMQSLFTNRDLLRENAGSALEAVEADEAMNPLEKQILSIFLRSLDTFAADMPGLANGQPDPAGDEAEGAETPAEGGYQGFNPVKINIAEVTAEKASGPPNTFSITFPQGITWGILGCAASFGISLVVERTRGTLTRLRTAPISGLQVLMGKALACFITIIGVVTVLLIIGFAVGVRPVSPALLALAIICIALGFTGIMMLLSVVGKTEAAAGGIGWAVLTIMAMLGGGMVPVFFMPTWMRSLGSISPVKWAIYAMEGAIWRGYDLGQMLLPCGILIAIGIAGLIIGTAIFERTSRA